ncbi:Ankyrin_repeat protein 3 [Hexamita inflata]|uniref:Ankyrin_repeat protein 3 n=1 Tax=Hexamita inflata TaxID=28002 RepID=A0ABP1K225_9EUKA
MQGNNNDNDQQQTFQRCPNCKILFEIEGGQNHITCICGAHWCYVCGKQFTQDTIYPHLTQVHGGYSTQ